MRTPIMLGLIALAACSRGDAAEAYRLTNGDARRGREFVHQVGCGACHTIKGVPSATGLVGPPLAGIRQRMFIAGVLANSPDNMVRWLVNPPAVDNKTAMPNLGLTPQQARDITAFLYTLE